MRLESVHFLLTYSCTHECDHCFVFSRPGAGGTFAIAQVERVLDQAVALGTVTGVFFEGGEPFLYYATMLEGIRLACQRGLTAGIVTNGYWGTSAEDADLWLRPLKELGLSKLCVSVDPLHYGDRDPTPADHAIAAAERLGMSPSRFRTESPCVQAGDDGEPIVRGGVMFRGRAADKLTQGLPTLPCASFTKCPHEDLRNPRRVHVDANGNVHLCQGLLMGNLWQTPLQDLAPAYDPDAHPVCGPLLRGGPAALAQAHGLEHAPDYVDACHFCYAMRRALLDRFPQWLGPPHVYGLG
jgi:hypothetical protein